MLRWFYLSCFMLVFPLWIHSQDLYLKDNLKTAKTGDYIALAQNKHYLLLFIQNRSTSTLTLEEIAILAPKVKKNMNWKDWIAKGAPHHTSWVRYTIDLASGTILEYYSFDKKAWLDVSASNNFLSTLLNLQLQPVPSSQRKKIGQAPNFSTPDFRHYWHPPFIYEGQVIKDVAFEAWTTRWPKDGSELSGKTIELYLPEQGSGYPTYFPYWLQISGSVGKAKIRMVDSGSEMHSFYSEM